MRGSPVCTGPNQQQFYRGHFLLHFFNERQSEFLSWVAEPWTEVFDGLMLPVHLAKLEVLLRLGLKIPSLTPGVPILLWFLIVLSGDVQLRVFLVTPTHLHAEPTTNAFDVFMLSGDKLLREISTHKFYRKFVTRSFPMPPPMTAGSKSPTPTDNLWNLSTMRVSAIGLLLGSTCVLESLIVSTCSSKS